MSVIQIQGDPVSKRAVQIRQNKIHERGFFTFRLLGGYDRRIAGRGCGVVHWYVDVSCDTSTTAADINALVAEVFEPLDGEIEIFPASWHYIPLTGLVCIMQGWRFR